MPDRCEKQQGDQSRVRSEADRGGVKFRGSRQQVEPDVAERGTSVFTLREAGATEGL